MILFIKGNGKSAMARRVANQLGGLRVTLSAHECLNPFGFGVELMCRPANVIIENADCRPEFMYWITGVTASPEMTIQVKNRDNTHIRTPNFIVCVEGGRFLRGRDWVDLGDQRHHMPGLQKRTNLVFPNADPVSLDHLIDADDTLLLEKVDAVRDRYPVDGWVRAVEKTPSYFDALVLASYHREPLTPEVYARQMLDAAEPLLHREEVDPATIEMMERHDSEIRTVWELQERIKHYEGMGALYAEANRILATAFDAVVYMANANCASRHDDSFYSDVVLSEWDGLLKGDEVLRKLQILTDWTPPSEEFAFSGSTLSTQLAALIGESSHES